MLHNIGGAPRCLGESVILSDRGRRHLMGVVRPPNKNPLNQKAHRLSHYGSVRWCLGFRTINGSHRRHLLRAFGQEGGTGVGCQ